MTGLICLQGGVVLVVLFVVWLAMTPPQPQPPLDTGRGQAGNGQARRDD